MSLEDVKDTVVDGLEEAGEKAQKIGGAVEDKVEDIAEADLAACAERYLLDCGLGKDELNALKENLAKDYTK